MRMIHLISVLAVAAACRGKEPPQQQVSGMGGMTMRSDSLMPVMRAHLDSLSGMPTPFAAGMLLGHDALASQMLDAMGSDMAMMGMRPDSAWAALADSAKRDLAELPTLSGGALTTRVQAHIGRVRRLLDMHAAMMRH